jgi:hypothetical protein
VDRVGNERANTEGEVRRYFNGSNRAFHDAIYHEGNMPVEMVRLAINGQKVARNYQSSRRFYNALA